MYSAQLFVLCFCGSLILERYGVLGQVFECMAGETLSAVFTVCLAPPVCDPPTEDIVGRFAGGVGSGNCVVTETGVAGDACVAIILTCITDPTTTTTATTTTAAAVDSPESVGSPESVDSSASDNSRRR